MAVHNEYGKNQLCLESESGFSLECEIEFNSDENYKILTEEQLEDENQQVRDYLHECGALR